MSSEAGAIVLKTLRDAGGAQTTRDLHEKLHQLEEPLPKRLPPRGFLKGKNRILFSGDQADRRDSNEVSYPGKAMSAHGRWSMTYLKRHVLAKMERQGDIAKVTKQKWAKVTGAQEEPDLPDMSTDEWQSRTKRQRRVTGQHVWVVKDDFHQQWLDYLSKHEAQQEDRAPPADS